MVSCWALRGKFPNLDVPTSAYTSSMPGLMPHGHVQNVVHMTAVGHGLMYIIWIGGSRLMNRGVVWSLPMVISLDRDVNALGRPRPYQYGTNIITSSTSSDNGHYALIIMLYIPSSKRRRFVHGCKLEHVCYANNGNFTSYLIHIAKQVHTQTPVLSIQLTESYTHIILGQYLP